MNGNNEDNPFLIPTTGTGAWENALMNTLSNGDRIVSFIIGQFSLLWVDQQKRLGFDVDVVECEWCQGANLGVLASKLAADTIPTIKAICNIHNETATGDTNNLASVRKILDHYQHPTLLVVDGVSSVCARDFCMGVCYPVKPGQRQFLLICSYVDGNEHGIGVCSKVAWIVFIDFDLRTSHFSMRDVLIRCQARLQYGTDVNVRQEQIQHVCGRKNIFKMGRSGAE